MGIKRKKTFMQSCVACGRRPGPSVPWGASEMKMGTSNPVGNKCQECLQCHSIGFPYLTWDSFVKLYQTEEP